MLRRLVMSLKCSKCGSRDTFVCGAKDLTAKTGNPMFMTTAAGVVALHALPALVGMLLAAGKAVFEYLGWREKNNPPIVVCKACGAWERISG
jgi:hypothetical protein